MATLSFAATVAGASFVPDGPLYCKSEAHGFATCSKMATSGRLALWVTPDSSRAQSPTAVLVLAGIRNNRFPAIDSWRWISWVEPPPHVRPPNQPGFLWRSRGDRRIAIVAIDGKMSLPHGAYLDGNESIDAAGLSNVQFCAEHGQGVRGEEPSRCSKDGSKIHGPASPQTDSAQMRQRCSPTPANDVIS